MATLVPVVVVVALVQKRTTGLAIVFGMLLGPFGFRCPPGCRRGSPETPVGTHIGTPITIGTDIGTARDGPTTTCNGDGYKVIEGGALEIWHEDGSKLTSSPTRWGWVEEDAPPS